MNRKLLLLTVIMMSMNAVAQNVMTPELLWKLGRVSPLGISKDGKNIVYKVSIPSVEENKSTSKLYTIPLAGGNPVEIKESESLLKDKNVSPDGKTIVYSEEAKIEKVLGKDYYPAMEKSNVQIYDALDYRHWDTWNEGKHNHVFYKSTAKDAVGIDIMKDEPYD
ncbi:MAG: S9 family peptidase, partial [Flavobacterium sp.]